MTTSEKTLTRKQAYAREWYKKNQQEQREKAIVRVHGYRVTMQQLVREHFEKNCCVDCGQTDIRVLEFDHVRGTKKHNIGDLIGKGCGNPQTLHDEIKKCDVVCANCHRIRTYTRADSWRCESSQTCTNRGAGTAR